MKKYTELRDNKTRISLRDAAPLYRSHDSVDGLSGPELQRRWEQAFVPVEALHASR